MKKVLYLFCMTSVAVMSSCVSSESKKLSEARTLQATILTEAHVLDSTLVAETQQLEATRELMSADSLLITDSLFQARYASIKTKLYALQGIQAEVSAWHNSIVKLPSKEELKKGIKNPFGPKSGDQEVYDRIALYRVKLNEFTERANEARSSK